MLTFQAGCSLASVPLPLCGPSSLKQNLPAKIAAGADLLVTTSMVYYLRGSKTQFDRTNAILQTIVLNVVETNALTLVVAIVRVSSTTKADSALTWSHRVLGGRNPFPRHHRTVALGTSELSS